MNSISSVGARPHLLAAEISGSADLSALLSGTSPKGPSSKATPAELSIEREQLTLSAEKFRLEAQRSYVFSTTFGTLAQIYQQRAELREDDERNEEGRDSIPNPEAMMAQASSFASSGALRLSRESYDKLPLVDLRLGEVDSKLAKLAEAAAKLAEAGLPVEPKVPLSASLDGTSST